MAAKEVVLRFRLKPTQKLLLDIGGGHGVYAAEYCRKYPFLKSMIFDLPPSVEIGKEIVAKYYKDVAGRIDFTSGDLAKDPIGKGYDVIFLFNVIHHFDSDGIRQASRKIWEALNPGGQFVVLDQFKHSTRAGSYFAVLTHLMFLVTSNAESIKLEDMRVWLGEAGFGNVQSKSLRIGPGTSLVIATKK
jgi:SAM-dependent methyltransferase